MKNIEWNKVTWYSKALAVIIFIATFVIAFHLGRAFERVYPDNDTWSDDSSMAADSGANNAKAKAETRSR